MRTVYDEWTPLKKVLIGKSFNIDNIDDNLKNKILFSYNTGITNRKKKYEDSDNRNNFEDDIFNYATNDTLKKVHDETNEDLDVLSDICKQYGAEVVRPDLIYSISTLLEHPMQCRDVIGKIGNVIFEVNTASSSRQFENYNHRKVMLDEFENGARYISMPPAIYEYEPSETFNDDIDERNRKQNKRIESYDNQKQIIGDTAAFYKCGKHIFHTHANPQTRVKNGDHSKICITKNGLEWWKKEFPLHEFINLDYYGHVDGKISILRPGLVLTWNEKYVPQIMKDHNWDIIIVENTPAYSGKTIKQLCEESGVNKYPFEHLLGISQETRFDANCLSLDENTVITSGYDKDIANKLKKYNIEMIPWINRWNFLWSGGAHCCSVDLERAGNLVDYFS